MTQVRRKRKSWSSASEDQITKSDAALQVPPAERTCEQRNDIVLANKALCYSNARVWLGANGFGLDDLAHAGMRGLIRAAEKYDMSVQVNGKSVAFSVYATYWIRQAITRWLEETRFIRIPSHWRYKPEYEELDNSTRVHNFVEYDDGSQFDPKEIPAPETIECDDRHRLAEVFEVLDEREKYIVTHIFGLNDAPCMTFRGIAKQLGISYERVNQLNQKALRKLRHAFTRSR